MWLKSKRTLNFILLLSAQKGAMSGRGSPRQVRTIIANG